MWIATPRRLGLGDGSTSTVYMQSTPADLQAAIAAAQQAGVVQGVNDSATLTSLYNAGADPVQLALAATNAQLGASSVIASDLQTVNQDVGASNYVGANPPASALDQLLASLQSVGPLGIPMWAWGAGAVALALGVVGSIFTRR